MSHARCRRECAGNIVAVGLTVREREQAESSARPQLKVSVNVNAEPRGEETFEVSLHLDVHANSDRGVIYNVELLYGGVFQIAGVEQEDMEPVLLIECPRYLFPFARRIIAEVTSEGGYPPFLLDPIDFAAVYIARKGEAGVQVGHA